jgi:Ca-activated chloride channel family protein
MKNRNFSALLLIIISLACFTLTVGTQAAQQQNGSKLTVYVSALRGECLAGQDSKYITVKGRSMRRSHLAPEQSLTPLEFFSEDSSTRNQIEELFSKQKNLSVVKTAEAADFAFCVCTQFRGGDWNGYDRLGVTASAVSSVRFSRFPASPKLIKESAFWHKDNLLPAPTERYEPSRTGANADIYIYQNYVGGDLPKDLAKQFLEELPGLTEKIAALPKATTNAGEPMAAKTQPRLNKPVETETQALPTNSLQPAGNNSESVRIQTTLVTVPVTVTNKNGHAVSGLTPQDFSLYEDKIKQELASFGQLQQPFHVVMMIDRSCNVGSVQSEEFKEAGLYFFDRLPPKSKMMVVSFAREVLIESEFTEDREKLGRAFSRRISVGDSVSQRLNDALEFVLKGRLHNVKGRKIIILFTNGEDNGSELANWRDPAKRLAEEDVTVFPVDPVNAISARMGTQLGLRRLVATASNRAKTLERIAEETGGAYYLLPSIGHAPQAFASIAGTLNQFYWLSYYPTNDTRDNRFRQIKVEVNRPEAKARARKGYQAGGSGVLAERQSK